MKKVFICQPMNGLSDLQMAKEYVEFEGDNCYVDTPINHLGDCCDYQRRLVMTKEAFKECYKKWILEEKEQE